ncbi:MAG: OmpH family outer membrane protein [Bacteroidales bacterium]
MKKASIITNAILGAAVIVLFILHFTSKPVVNTVTEMPEGDTSLSGGIVYINIDSLISQYDMFNDLRTEFESKAQAIQNDLNKRGRTLENDVKDFQTKVQKGLITRSQAEAQQQQLAKREQELQGYIRQKQEELGEEEQVLNRRVFDALQTYIDKMNQEKQYSLILSTSGYNNTVIQGDKSLNITSSVVEAMNDEYIKQRSK